MNDAETMDVDSGAPFRAYAAAGDGPGDDVQSGGSEEPSGVVEWKHQESIGDNGARVREDADAATGSSTPQGAGVDDTRSEERRQRRAQRFQSAALQHANAELQKDAALVTPTGQNMFAPAGPSVAAQPITAEMKLGDFLEARRDASESETLAPDTLHLHGVDKLSTQDVRSMFAAFGASRVAWINDSSCNVTLRDSDALASALSIDPEKRSQREELVAWHDVPSFVKDGVRMLLTARVATSGDRRPERPNKHSAWSRAVQGSGDLRAKLNRVRAGIEKTNRSGQAKDLRALLPRGKVSQPHPKFQNQR